MGHGRIALAATFAGVILGGVAAADRVSPEQAAHEAEDAAKRGDFAGAAAKFRVAYRLDPQSDYLCNIGVAYQKAKDLARAHWWLTRCVAHGSVLDAKFVDAVRANLTTIEAELRGGSYAPVEIVIAPSAASFTLDDWSSEEKFVGDTEIWLAWGHHEIRIHGITDKVLAFDVDGHELVPLHVTLDPPPVEHSRPNGLDRNPPPPDPPRHRQPSKSAAAFATVVTAGLGVAVVLANQHAQQQADRAGIALSSSTFDGDRGSVDTWNRVVGVTGTVFVLGAATSSYLWYRYFHGRHADSRVERAGLAPIDGGASLWVTGSF